MAETSEITKSVDSRDFWVNLDEVDRSNVHKIMDSVQHESKKQGLDVHLVAVGGTVDPKKRNTPRKDIDIVLYSQELAIENSPSTGVKNFDKYEGFVKSAINFEGWSAKTTEPFWQDWDISVDGLIEFTPEFGKPIEIITVRRDVAAGSFEEFLANERRPFSVLL